MEEYELVPICEQMHLVGDVIKMINEEWPRSETSRQRSLQKTSSSKPPMALIFVKKNKEKKYSREDLFGHLKLCDLPYNEDGGCWVESFLIKVTNQGQGLGKIMLKLLEDVARSFNFSVIYLSTHVEKFYLKAGYVECEKITNMGANSGLLSRFNKSLNIGTQVKVKKEVNIGDKKVTSNRAPPPPPLPAKQLELLKEEPKTIWLKKYLNNSS
uniref:N-acetyltransferase domain-containing protein n=1 Tax=Rhabditophanes sp. KR3021 TaxID=114890 RepID=A0AC35TJ03_9BILA